jgi:hypothetical protein
MSRFQRPDTATLTLANGDTLIVRRRLNSGEQRAAFGRLYSAGVDGALRVDPLQVDMATVTAYLLDWHLKDDDVPIRGLSMEDLTATLNNLTPEDFIEIKQAIEAHEMAMNIEREEKKMLPAGANAS